MPELYALKRKELPKSPIDPQPEAKPSDQGHWGRRVDEGEGAWVFARYRKNSALSPQNGRSNHLGLTFKRNATRQWLEQPQYEELNQQG